MSTVRIAVVTDIHHGDESFTKKGPAALPLLEEVCAAVDSGSFDALIELGDRISDEDPLSDRRRAREVGERLARVSVPRFHVCGNHDLENLGLTENEGILNAPLGSRVVELNGLQLVFWQPDTRVHRPGGFRLAAGDLNWLRHALEVFVPTVLFTHVPLSGQAQTGNFYFERNPEHAGFREQDAIRQAIAECRAPVIGIAGHVHWNTLTVLDGVPHISLQSLTESFTTPGRPAAAWATLTIGDDLLKWRAFGCDPAAYELPLPPRGPGRWVPPLPRFSEMTPGAQSEKAA
jgi:Icc-related predicted phosphoesterase